MATKIIIPAIRSTVTEHTITYVDGTVIKLTGSNTVALRSAAYIEENDKPVIEPPVIIPPKGAREITWDDLGKIKDVENEKFIIKPGSFDWGIELQNFKNVSIEGNNKIQISSNYRGIQLFGGMEGLTLSGLNFKNCNDRVISIYQADKLVYNGKEGSSYNNLTLKNIVCDNSGALFHADGNIRDKGYDGVLKGFKMFGCKITNSNGGNLIYIGNAVDFDIYNNVIDSVNQANNEHNGLFFIKGTGKFHHNKASNHQGNFLRSWLHSIDGLKTVEVYNNTVYGSRKYSAFELQATGGIPANARVYNNTAGRMNVSKDWEGQMLDLYNTGGTLEYFDNLGFDMVASRGVTNMINNMSDTKIIRESGNKYYGASGQAVSDVTSFKSLHTGIGAQ